MLGLHPTVLHQPPTPSLHLQHSSLEAPAHQPGTCRVLKRAQDAASFTADALSGTSPAKHFVLPSTRRQTPTIYSGLSLQTMTQGNPEGSQKLTSHLCFQAMELPTYSQVSHSLVSPGVSYTRLSHGSSSHTETRSNNLMG